MVKTEAPHFQLARPASLGRLIGISTFIFASIAAGTLFFPVAHAAPIRRGEISNARMLEGHKYLIGEIDLSGVAVWDLDRVWDHADNAIVDRFSTSHYFPIEHPAWSASGRYVTARPSETTEALVVIDLLGKENAGAIALDEDGFRSGSLDQAGRRLIYRGEKLLHHASTDSDRAIAVEIGDQEVDAMAVDWNHDQMALAFANGTISFRNTKTLEQIFEIAIHPESLESIRFTPNGNRLIAVIAGRIVLIPLDEKEAKNVEKQLWTTREDPRFEAREYVVSGDTCDDLWKIRAYQDSASISKIDADGNEIPDGTYRLALDGINDRQILTISEKAGYVAVKNDTKVDLIDKAFGWRALSLESIEPSHQGGFDGPVTYSNTMTTRRRMLPRHNTKLGCTLPLPDLEAQSLASKYEEIEVLWWLLSVATKVHQRYDRAWFAIHTLAYDDSREYGRLADELDLKELGDLCTVLLQAERLQPRESLEEDSTPESYTESLNGLQSLLRETRERTKAKPWTNIDIHEATWPTLLQNAWHLVERDLWLQFGDAARLKGDRGRAQIAYAEALKKEPKAAAAYDGLLMLYLDDEGGDFARWWKKAEKTLAPRWLNGGGSHIPGSSGFYSKTLLLEQRDIAIDLARIKKEEEEK